MPESPDIISELLTGTVDDLDLPDKLQSILEQTYDQVGLWMTDHIEGDGDWMMYPQGSGRLGTAVPPAGSDEFDIDAVAECDVDKEDITKDELKDVVGSSLRSYVTAHADETEKGAPTHVEPGRRCWTLEFDEPFHMDILPAVPNREAAPGGIWITDRDLVRWQPSNPKGYADWFFEQAGQPYLDSRAAMARTASVDVDDIPSWRVKTPLQRTVQIFKLHRNAFFSDNLDARPPSIMITTLIAHAYGGQTGLYESVMACATDIPLHLRYEDGTYVLPNPTQPDENFAERFSTNDEGVRLFLPWLTDLRQTLECAYTETNGLDRVVARLETRFTPASVRSAAAQVGQLRTQARKEGKLAVATTGLLGANAGTASMTTVRDHEFFGE